jgi:hypothetical protein
MEVIRLIKWDNVAPGFVPMSFKAPYNLNPADPASTNGLYYYGTVTVTNAPLTESYSNDLRMIKIDLTWTSGGVTKSRQMTTFTSQFGLQRYIY